MTYYIFASQEDAQSLSDTVDATLGYPMEGDNVGDGYHSPDPVVTLNYAPTIVKPDASAYAYFVDSFSQPVVDAHPELTGIATIAEVLDASWYPPDPKAQQG